MCRPRLICFLLASLLVAGCGQGASSSGSAANSGYAVGEINFLDEAPPNVSVAPSMTSLSFTRPDGSEVALQDFVGQKTVVLVITRGNTGAICPYCSTQTARLITGYDEFAARSAEVVVVYPVEKAADSPHLDAFLAASRTILNDPNRPIPFPVLLDVELHAINHLGIRKNLSKPATYIIDPSGEVRYAYVGNHLADRPSVKALLKQLDQLGAPTGAPVTEAATE